MAIMACLPTCDFRHGTNMAKLMNRGSGLRIGKILGIPIYLRASWVIVFSLITFSLAMQFAQEHPRWSTVQHWSVGILTSFLFFGSVLFHELSHSVVAQRYKIRVVSITLFIFGGVARIGSEPSKAIQEFNIAIAGPLASFLLYLMFKGLTLIFPYSETLGALAAWLAFINFRLALFNLIPGFPLDGGRIFRAIIWGSTQNYARATRIAGTSGKLVAYGFILIGAWAAFHPDFMFTIGSSTIFYGGFSSCILTAFFRLFLLYAAPGSGPQGAGRQNPPGLPHPPGLGKEMPPSPRPHPPPEYRAALLPTRRRV